MSVSHVCVEQPEAADPESGLQVIMALWQVFTGLTDPRDPRGVRHELASVLTITVLAVLCGADGVDFPHARQVFRIRRQVFDLSGHRLSKEYVHGIPSLTAERADPKQLLDMARHY